MRNRAAGHGSHKAGPDRKAVLRAAARHRGDMARDRGCRARPALRSSAREARRRGVPLRPALRHGARPAVAPARFRGVGTCGATGRGGDGGGPGDGRTRAPGPRASRWAAEGQDDLQGRSRGVPGRAVPNRHEVQSDRAADELLLGNTPKRWCAAARRNCCSPGRPGERERVTSGRCSTSARSARPGASRNSGAGEIGRTPGCWRRIWPAIRSPTSPGAKAPPGSGCGSAYPRRRPSLFPHPALIARGRSRRRSG